MPNLRVSLWWVVLLIGFAGGFALAGRNAGGSYTLPAGNPVITGTTIQSTWANNTLNDVATEMTNSLDRQGRGAMLAPLKLVSGTAANPGAAFSAEPSSGPYRNAAGDIRWSVLSTDTFKWQTASNTSMVPLAVTGRTTTTNLTVTGSSDTLTVQALTAGFFGLHATGATTGAGVFGSGGPTNGVGGVFAGGGATGTGLTAIGGTGVAIGGSFQGGTTGGNAGQFDAQAGNAAGVIANGHGSSPGVQGAGGATSGPGLYGLGGAPNGVGIYGVSQGTGSGIYGQSAAAGAAAIEALNGVVATGATRQDAIRAGGGDINLNGTANATSTTAMRNRLAPNNMVKAWATIEISAATTVSVIDGFNIASVALSTNNFPVAEAQGNDTVDVVFAQGFSNSTYAIATTQLSQSCAPTVLRSTTTSAQVSFNLVNANGAWIGHGTAKSGCAQLATANFTPWAVTRFTFIAIGNQP